MIRRDSTDEHGGPTWVLITQIEHARLAGDLAAEWGRGPFSAVAPREVVLPTIYRHDDGWAAWERRPTIDPATGRPRSFTEMPNDVAHDIWRQSIESVADLGPLAQYIVAQHFIRLRQAGDGTHEASVAEFLAEFGKRSEQWLAAWQANDAAGNTLEVAETALSHLQLFDALSLTLCCSECIGHKPLTTPLGVTLQMDFQGQGVRVSPWPWTVEELTVRAVGHVLPAVPLESSGQLQRLLQSAPEKEIVWQLLPAN